MTPPRTSQRAWMEAKAVRGLDLDVLLLEGTFCSSVMVITAL